MRFLLFHLFFPNRDNDWQYKQTLGTGTEWESKLILLVQICCWVFSLGNITSEKISWNIRSASLIRTVSLLWLSISRWSMTSSEIARSLFLEPKSTFLKSVVKKNFLYPLFLNLPKQLFLIFAKFLFMVLKRTYLRNSPD